MELNEYRTTINGQEYRCKARTKSEARGEFKKIIAKRLGITNMFILPHSLHTKVRLCKFDD